MVIVQHGASAAGLDGNVTAGTGRILSRLAGRLADSDLALRPVLSSLSISLRHRSPMKSVWASARS